MAKPVTLGQSLRHLRRAAGLSRRRLAAEAGVSSFVLQQVEGDSCRPHLPTLEKLVRALGVSFEQLSAWVPEWPQEAFQAVLEGVLNEMVAGGVAEVREGPNGREYRVLPPQN